MSFALDYRKKMQANASKSRGGKKKARAKTRPADFVIGPAKKSSDTRGNRRRALAALTLAGLILSVFNSAGLVQYAGGLGYNQAALRVMIASENWHALMERSRMTGLTDGIRDAVMTARHSQWRDLAFGLDLTPTHPYLTEPETVRSDEPAVPHEQEPRDAPDNPTAPLDSPMMRAEAGRYR